MAYHLDDREPILIGPVEMNQLPPNKGFDISDLEYISDGEVKMDVEVKAAHAMLGSAEKPRVETREGHPPQMWGWGSSRDASKIWPPNNRTLNTHSTCSPFLVLRLVYTAY